MTDDEQTAWQTMGFDTQRIWANQVHVTVNQDIAQLVFKEVGMVQLAEGADPVEVSKNVAAVLLPTEVLASMNGIASRLLGERATAAEREAAEAKPAKGKK